MATVKAKKTEAEEAMARAGWVVDDQDGLG